MKINFCVAKFLPTFAVRFMGQCDLQTRMIAHFLFLKMRLKIFILNLRLVGNRRAM